MFVCLFGVVFHVSRSVLLLCCSVCCILSFVCIVYVCCLCFVQLQCVAMTAPWRALYLCCCPIECWRAGWLAATCASSFCLLPPDSRPLLSLLLFLLLSAAADVCMWLVDMAACCEGVSACHLVTLQCTSQPPHQPCRSQQRAGREAGR